MVEYFYDVISRDYYIIINIKYTRACIIHIYYMKILRENMHLIDNTTSVLSIKTAS